MNAEETLPAELPKTLSPLQWQYGQDVRALVYALQQIGIVMRFFEGKLMLDIQEAAAFSILTREEARQMWNTVEVLKDHRRHLYIPLGNLISSVILLNQGQHDKFIFSYRGFRSFCQQRACISANSERHSKGPTRNWFCFL